MSSMKTVLGSYVVFCTYLYVQVDILISLKFKVLVYEIDIIFVTVRLN